MERKAIVLNPNDNVATALTDLGPEDKVDLEVGDKTVTVQLVNSIPFGHKFSLVQVKAGSPIMKYGEVIGEATADIEPGQHVHVHNVASTRGRGDKVKQTTK